MWALWNTQHGWLKAVDYYYSKESLPDNKIGSQFTGGQEFFFLGPMIVRSNEYFIGNFIEGFAEICIIDGKLYEWIVAIQYWY